MAFRITVHKANGDVERTRVDGDETSTFVQKWEGTRGVVVKNSTPWKVGYNFGGGDHPSKAAREAEIREGLEAHRREYVHTKGMSKGGTMKHVASIPAELWWSEKAESGPSALRDPKELKRFCSKWGLNVSKW